MMMEDVNTDVERVKKTVTVKDLKNNTRSV